MERVPSERLEPHPDDERLLLDGRPFTGIGVDDGDGGAFRGETEYRDGLQHGMTRVWWRETGMLNAEQAWVAGEPHGPSRTWFPDGTPREAETYDHGVCVRRRTWSERGVLIEDVDGDEAAHDDSAYDVDDLFDEADDDEEDARRG